MAMNFNQNALADGSVDGRERSQQGISPTRYLRQLVPAGKPKAFQPPGLQAPPMFSGNMGQNIPIQDMETDSISSFGSPIHDRQLVPSSSSGAETPEKRRLRLETEQLRQALRCPGHLGHLLYL